MISFGIEDASMKTMRIPAASTRCAYCGGTITARDYAVESCPHCGGPTNIPANQPPIEEYDIEYETEYLMGDDKIIAEYRYPVGRMAGE